MFGLGNAGGESKPGCCVSRSVLVPALHGCFLCRPQTSMIMLVQLDMRTGTSHCTCAEHQCVQQYTDLQHTQYKLQACVALSGAQIGASIGGGAGEECRTAHSIERLEELPRSWTSKHGTRTATAAYGAAPYAAVAVRSILCHHSVCLSDALQEVRCRRGTRFSLSAALCWYAALIGQLGRGTPLIIRLLLRSKVPPQGQCRLVCATSCGWILR